MFGKKTADDLLRAFKTLTDEERAKFLESIKQVEETHEEVAETGDVEENASENVQITNEEPLEEESESAEIQESNDELPESNDKTDNESTEAPENTSDIGEESIADENTEEQQAVDEAQIARIEALESEIAALKEKMNSILDNFENEDFGLSPSAPESDGEDEERFSAVMRGYAGSNAKKYY